MPSPLLVDLSTVDLQHIAATREAVRELNPQRFEMEHLDGIIHLDLEGKRVVGFKSVGSNEFWVRGHIPGRPLLPGVLMLEAAAQLCSFLYKKVFPERPERFLGFAGIEAVKFRGAVVPGDTLFLLAAATDLRARRAVFQTQGVVNDRLVFEATIIGMPV